MRAFVRKDTQEVTAIQVSFFLSLIYLFFLIFENTITTGAKFISINVNRHFKTALLKVSYHVETSHSSRLNIEKNKSQILTKPSSFSSSGSSQVQKWYAFFFTLKNFRSTA